MVQRLARVLALLIVLAAPAAAQAAFPGSNGAIAYTDEVVTSSNPGQILSIDPPNLNPIPLTNDPGYDSFEVAWSPDGRRIALGRVSTGGGQDHIWIANADGSGLRQVTFASGGQSEPSWSPDGHHIVFGSGGLQVLNVDDPADTPHTIPGTAGSDGDPTWSPDGGLIAFIRSLNQLAVIAPDGSGFNVLNTAPSGPPVPLSDASPAWSPDGARVYFSQGPTPVGCSNPPYQIYWVPRTGGGPTLVSRDPTLSEYYVAPSPDGSQLAFSRCDDPTSDRDHIYVANIDGTGAHAVTSGSDNYDLEPDWQPVAPRFASAPTITGNAVNNQQLIANAGSSPGGGSGTLQFERCDAKGANCVPIPGTLVARARQAASTAPYRLGSVDIGHAIRVRQTQTNGLGTASIESAPTAAVIPSRGHCSNLFAASSKQHRVRGSSGSDRIRGTGGKDRLFGLGGADCIRGGPGSDFLSGGRGNDSLSGGTGSDTIIAGPGRNRVSAGSGNDTINVRNHRRDRVNCGKGRDRVIADRVDKLRGCERVTRRR